MIKIIQTGFTGFDGSNALSFSLQAMAYCPSRFRRAGIILSILLILSKTLFAN